MNGDLYDIQLLQQHSQDKFIKIELLDMKTEIVLENIEGALISDSGTIDSTSNSRRSYNADFYVKDSTFLVDSNNKIWMDKYIRVYTGILDQRSQNIVYYIIGTYVITDAGYNYDASTKTVSLTLLDKMALLDGTLGGKITGALDMTIKHFVNDEYYSTVILVTDSEGVEYSETKYTQLGEGTVVTIPIPTSSSTKLDSVVIKFDNFKDTAPTNTDDIYFMINYPKYIAEIDDYEDVKIKYSYKQGTVDGIDIENIIYNKISSVKVTLLNDMDVYSISIYNSTNMTTPIIKWSLSGDDNILDPLVDKDNSSEYADVLDYLKDYDSLKTQYDSGGYSNKESNFENDINNLKTKYGAYTDSDGNEVAGDFYVEYHPNSGTESSCIIKYKNDGSEEYQTALKFIRDYSNCLLQWDLGLYVSGAGKDFGWYQQDLIDTRNEYGVTSNGTNFVCRGYVVKILSLEQIYDLITKYNVSRLTAVDLSEFEPYVLYQDGVDIGGYNDIIEYLKTYDELYELYEHGGYDDDDDQYTRYMDDLADISDGYVVYKNAEGYYVVNGYIIQYINTGSKIIGYAETSFTNSIKTFEYKGSGTWNSEPITFDTTTGRETLLEEVLQSGLESAGITEYEIRDIQEVVPYDQEFSVGVTWFEVFQTLINLYQDIEIFFDEYGTFVVQYYSTIEDNDIVLSNEVLQGLQTSINYTNSFPDVHNVTEIWGSDIESDVYAENTEEEPYLVKFSNNNFSVIFPDLDLTDQGKISDGTVMAFKTPADMKLTDSPTLTINGIKLTSTDITNIDKIFTCDELETSSISKTGYRIDEDTVYSVNLGCATIYTEDVIIEKKNGYKYIPDNGETNWSYYGARSANKNYGYEIANIIGSNNNPVTVDGIQFKGTFYNMQNAANMISISSTGVYSIDLSLREYCIYINAKEGEIYRIYYTHLNGYLYAAKASTGIFEKVNRPFINYSNAVNGMSYCDFVAPSTGAFYIFYYSTGTDNSDISFRLYGMSKITAQQGVYDILNYSDETKVDYTSFSPNTSYCFKYNDGKIYYLGQWQVHAVAIEVLTVPEKKSEKFNEYATKFNCNNIIFTQFDSRFAIENIGVKAQVLSGDDFEDIFSDDLALQRAEYENWKAVRLADVVSLTTIQIPWLDVNKKVTYQLPEKQLKTYTIERISYSNTSETMTIEMNTFYPLYMS